MKFLAIDTSSKRLIVIAKGEQLAVRDIPDCAMRHSVRLMDEIDGALKEAELSLKACDFLVCVVGPGSFTGIRIGISTVKGLCMAAEKPALAVTSFDCLAYAEGSGKQLALVDAGHGHFYACGYEDRAVTLSPRYISEEEVRMLIEAGYAPVSDGALSVESRHVSPPKGLLGAVNALHGNAAPCSALEALYLRKSSAEEGR